MTIFCLRDKLYRDAAPVPFTSFIYREKYPAIYQTYTATAPALNRICTMTAKSAPYLPCTGTTFRPRWRGVPGPCPDASSGNTNYSYHRAVMGNSADIQQHAILTISYIMTNYILLDKFVNQRN